MKFRTIVLPIALMFSSLVAPTAFATGEVAMTEGVIKKVDSGAGKVTIKHGPIVNLDMPPMSMVFGVQDVAMLQGFAKGDNVSFHVVDKEGKMVIEVLQAAD